MMMMMMIIGTPSSSRCRGSKQPMAPTFPLIQLMSLQSIQWKEDEEVGVIEVAVIEHLMVVVGEFCLIFGRNNIMYMNIVMI